MPAKPGDSQKSVYIYTMTRATIAPVGNPAPVADSATGKLILAFCRDNREVFTTESTDDGVTWANIVNITNVANSGGWRFVGTGPPGGIQLSSGRLLIGTTSSVVHLYHCISLALPTNDTHECHGLSISQFNARSHTLVYGFSVMPSIKWKIYSLKKLKPCTKVYHL